MPPELLRVVSVTKYRQKTFQTPSKVIPQKENTRCVGAGFAKGSLARPTVLSSTRPDRYVYF